MKISIFSKIHLQALVFSLLLGAMVGVLEVGGAMKVLVQKISRRIRSRRDAQTLVATSGLAIFFDDYANTLLVGGTMRSTADKYQMSRSKLAYLVDSTAAPVAGLSIISTWAATEISYMAQGLEAAGVTDPSAGFELFLHSIPYRFYPILAIAMVFIIAWTGRDFGPMATEEKKAGSADESTTTEVDEYDDAAKSRSSNLWLAAVVPVALCVLSVGVVLLVTGYQAYEKPAEPISTARYLGMIFSNGDSYVALMVGGAIGWACTSLMHCFQSKGNASLVWKGTWRGMKQMMPAMVILWFAWAISWMTESDQLDTSGYLASVLSDRLNPHWLPTAVFLLAGFTAFSTGTSWGTMGILTPIAVSLAVAMDPDGGPDGAICLATCGSVLAGAIFGDHCSPISDTTVLSSRASGCDHVSHVKTQMPYALVVGIVCVLVGSIPAAYGLSPWVSLLLGLAILIAAVKFLGRRP